MIVFVTFIIVVYGDLKLTQWAADFKKAKFNGN